ncbi:DNA topoisomerase [Caniella muris]|uniref:DNA topoisomerase n=1 Tax=Caniella muris TaxID=2941502 RepID=UPI00203CDCC9|nr:DNA topoisomerase [Caniella muris]
MICIMAEKRSAARHMIEALSGTDGPNRFTRDGEEICVTYASGHVLGYSDPHRQVPVERAWAMVPWDLSLLPWDAREIAWRRSVQPGRSAGEAWDRLSHDLPEADEIVIATDNDPTGEGSLLAWEVIDQLGLGEDRLVTRMRFADEEPASIVEAFENRDVLQSSADDPDCRKATWRCRWDYLSMQLTRAATRIAGGKDSMCRVGRLKSAMVTLVGQQEDARAVWRPRSRWQARYRDENGVVYSSEEAPLFDSPSEVDLAAFPDDNVVKDPVRRLGTMPPRLPDLMGIAARFAAKGVSTDEFTDVYQRLYEDGYVSYPRTEDKLLTREQFAALVAAKDRLAEACGVDAALLTHTEPRARHVSKKFMAHGAIRPGSKVPDDPQDLASYGACAPEIWKEVTRGALAILAEDYVYELRPAHLEHHPDYKGEARRTLRRGWRDVADDGRAKEEEPPGTRACAFVHEAKDKRPQEPSVDWLRKRLEKHDVGTGATRVSTLSEVCAKDPAAPRGRRPPRARQLMNQTKTGKIGLTDLGRTVYSLTRGCAIADLSTTERIQRMCRQASDGDLGLDAALADCTAVVEADIDRMRRNARDLGIEFRDPPAKEGASGVFEGTLAVFDRTYFGHRFTDAEVSRLLRGEEVALSGLASKRGGTFDTRVRLTRNERGFVRVSGDRSDWGPRDTFSGKALTEQEKADLAEGKVVFLEGLVNGKTGEVYDAHVRMRDGRISFCEADGSERGRRRKGPPRAFSGHAFTEAETEALRSGSVLEDVALKRKDGTPYTASIRYDAESGRIEFCGGRTADGPTRFSGHTFTDDERRRMLAGEIVRVEGLRRRDGTVYEAELGWDAKRSKVAFARELREGSGKPTKGGHKKAGSPRTASRGRS